MKSFFLRAVSPVVLSLLAALLSLVLFHWLADEIMEGETLDFDEAARAFIHAFATPALTVVMRIFSNIGGIPSVVIASLIACMALLWKRRPTAASLVSGAVGGAAILIWALKLLFQRERPQPYLGISTPADFSFPSGHALMSFCFYGVLAGILVAGESSRSQRIAIWSVAAIMAFGIGVSRIYLGVHYPSDVIGGYLAGLVWVLGVRLAALNFPDRQPTNHTVIR